MNEAFISSMVEGDKTYDALKSFARWASGISDTGVHTYNPYHNGRHTQCMVYNAVQCYVYETGEPGSPELVFSGYMHDYDHSGGYEPDVVNISRAIAGVKKFLKHPRLKHIDLEQVTGNIEVTWYDGVQFPNRPQTLEQMCMRDADLMTIYANDGPKQLIGLWREIIVLKPDFSLSQFVEANEKFLRRAPMYTAYGKAVKEKHLDAYLDQFERAIPKTLKELEA